MQRFVLSVLMVLLLASAAAASQVNPISLADLEARATYIVLAKVTKVDPAGDQDTVTIEVASFLKGEHDTKTFTFTLVTRGGIKDFDPVLKPGDTGVFFLKQSEDPAVVHKAYWGSVATFTRNYFAKP